MLNVKSIFDLTSISSQLLQEGAVKAVAREWRKLSPSQKQHWTDMARHDKARYSEEKHRYSLNAKGGSLVKKLRAKKDPRAPKRPMSAFLMYAQQQRKVLQAENPDMPNADISRLLGETWRNLRCVLPHQHMGISMLNYRPILIPYSLSSATKKNFLIFNVSRQREGFIERRWTSGRTTRSI